VGPVALAVGSEDAGGGTAVVDGDGDDVLVVGAVCDAVVAPV
jgi:hypothetical protein